MKTKTIIRSILAGLAAMPSLSLADETPQPGDILEGINMFTPEEGDAAYKVKAHEKYGTQWGLDLAYGYWGTHRASMNTPCNNNLALIHGQLNQRLIQDDLNGGTWLRVEISGSWALDPSSERANDSATYVEGFGTSTSVHPDVMGPHNLFFPEVALMHYFAGKRASLIAGVVNLTNYFDAVSIANDTFSSFVNSGFVNSTILPLVDSNVGAVLQVELGKKNYVMAAVSRTGVEMGYDPFNGQSDGYCVVGEYGHIFREGKGTIRLNPFFQMIDEEREDGAHHRRNAGLVGSVEFSPSDRITVYARTGFGAKQALGNSAELSLGAHFHPFSRRADDFIGLSYGIFKGANPVDAPTEHARESVLELMYSLQLSDWFKVVPHFQYIHDPAYSANSDACVFGVQGVFSF